MTRVERGVPLVERVLERITPHITPLGADDRMLDELESQLMVELPPTLRCYLRFDFTFAAFGSRWRGRGRFGSNPTNPKPKRTSIPKLAEAMTELGWTAARVRHRVIRLPNLPGEPWNCLYLGEPRRDGELPILGLVNDETNVAPYLRYTAFDLFLVEQSGLLRLSDGQRLEDLDSTLSLNRDLAALVPNEDYDAAF